jgi:hypothetical protein
VLSTGGGHFAVGAIDAARSLKAHRDQAERAPRRASAALGRAPPMTRQEGQRAATANTDRVISGSRSRLVALAVSAVATASPVVMICGAAAAAHKVGVSRLQTEQTAAIASVAQPEGALGGSGASVRNNSHFAPGNGPPPTAQSTTTGTAPGPAPTRTSAASTTAAPPPAPTTTSPAQLVINTPYDFAVGLLYALGDPLTTQNTGAIVSWAKAEGGNWNSPAKYNPLNTTKRMPGSYSINGAGVQAYSSWPQGVAATVQTLEGGAYSGILSALKTGSSEQAVERAVASSIWGTGSFQLLP